MKNHSLFPKYNRAALHYGYSVSKREYHQWQCSILEIPFPMGKGGVYKAMGVLKLSA